MFLKIITKLIEFAEKHTKKRKAIYQKLLSDIDQYIYETTGIVTLRYWRYFVLDKDWVDKVSPNDGKKTIEDLVQKVCSSTDKGGKNGRRKTFTDN